MPRRSIPFLLPFVFALSLVLAACGTQPQAPVITDPDPDPVAPVVPEGPYAVTVAPTAALAGGVVTLTYPAFFEAPEVTMDGIAAEVGLPSDVDGDVRTVAVTVPAGAGPYPSVVAYDGVYEATLDGADRTFFVGVDLAEASSVADLQDALDAAPEGSAVRIPSGTYDDVVDLFVDNRLLVGPVEGTATIEGISSLVMLVRGENTAGLFDLTVHTDDVQFYSGRINPDAVGVLTWPPHWDDHAETTSQGRFLIHTTTLTGMDVVEPSVDPETLEITAYGTASGAMSPGARLAAYELRDATIRFGEIGLWDSSAIGALHIESSDIWAESLFQIRQRAGDVTVDGSRIMLVGDPGDPFDWFEPLRIEMDGNRSSWVESDFSSTGGMRLGTDDGGDRLIDSSRFHARDDLYFRGDNIGDITVLDSSFVSVDGWVYIETEVGRIDMERTTIMGATVRVEIDEGGFLSIVDADWTSTDGRVHIYMDRAGDIDIRDSAFWGQTSVHVNVDNAGSARIENSSFHAVDDRVYFDLEEGHLTIVDVDITSENTVYFRIGDAGDMLLRDVTVEAAGRIDLYNDYFGSIRIEDSSFASGGMIDVSPWSGGVIQTTVLRSSFDALEDVRVDHTDGGDTLIEDSTIVSRSGSVRLLQRGGTLTVRSNTIEALGDPHPSDAFWLSDHDVSIASERNVTTVMDNTIVAAGSVLMVNGDERPPFDGGAAANDIVVSGNTLVEATVDIVLTSYADLIVTDNDLLSAGGAIELTAAYGLLDTTGTTFNPAPTLDGATLAP